MQGFIANKKVIAVVIFCMLAIIFFFTLAYGKEFFMSFRKSTSLNYQRDDVTYINIRSTGNLTDINNVIINDPEKIEEIIIFINSLDIVEVNKVPKNKFGYDLKNYGWISIYFGESSEYNPGDIIEFYTDYMGASYNGRDWEGKHYYRKNSGYNNQTKSSNVYEFLHDLINK